MADKIFSLLNQKDAKEIELTAKALASPLRLQLIRQIYQRPMTVIELAKLNKITNSTAIFHLNILIDAGIVRVQYLPSKKGSAQIFFLSSFNKITFLREPGESVNNEKVFEQSLGVGEYTNTACKSLGMAINGEINSWMSPFNNKRKSANMIWSFGGDFTYTFSNEFAKNNNVINKLEFSFEVCSETTCYRNDWKSDIFIAVNGIEIAHYLSPGDFGGTRGKYNPENWPSNLTQYGNLVQLSITDEGVFLNNQFICQITLKDLNLNECNGIELRIYNKKESTYYGGMNLFGKGSVNFNQDIVMTAFYSENNH